MGGQSMSADPIQSELDNARRFGEQLEGLVFRKREFTVEGKNLLLMAFWALLFDYYKGILLLLLKGFCGSAFALVRPVVEALVRSHVLLMGSDEDVKAIQEDRYRVNFETVGPEIDRACGLGGLFENLMKNARTALHSYTHSGTFQLARRYDGGELKPDYRSGEIIEVIRVTTSAIFMVTSLATKQLKFEDEWKAANELFAEWGKH